MERKKRFLTLILVISVFNVLASNKQTIYNAYVFSQMDVWKKTIDAMEKNKTTSANELIELVNYQYGYIGWCLGNDDKDQAKKYLKLAETNVENLEKQGFNPSLLHSYKAAFWGFKIAISPLKAPFFGKRCIKHVDIALDLDDSLPMGYVQHGTSYFHMPEMFGGSKEVALKSFHKAEKMMEENPEKIKNDWNYLSLLTIIAQSYEYINELEESKKYYEKVLSIEPGFVWVKTELYPELLNKLKE